MYLCVKGTHIFIIINHSILKKEIMFFLLMLWHNHCFVQMCLFISTVSQVSDVVHGPLFFMMWCAFVMMWCALSWCGVLLPWCDVLLSWCVVLLSWCDVLFTWWGVLLPWCGVTVQAKDKMRKKAPTSRVQFKQCINFFPGLWLLLNSDDDAKNTISYTPTCCGFIRRWIFKPVKPGSILFLVWRPTTTPGTYTLVGYNAYPVSSKMKYIVLKIKYV